MTVIEGAGTPEAHWTAWLAAARLPTALVPRHPRDPGPRDGGAPDRGPRAVVLAAHPDDEVLGAGGLLCRLGRTGWQVDVVWGSDGEASHPGSTVLAPDHLARRRRHEALAAREVLGLRGAVTWLGLPDSGLTGHEAELHEALLRVLPGADLLLAPWSDDGHPDHEVCGRVARRAGASAAVEVWELPVWAWHWGTGESLAPRWAAAHVVHLSEQERRLKARAIEAFVTQVAPLGPTEADRAVLPPEVLVRFARPTEVVLVTPAAAA